MIDAGWQAPLLLVEPLHLEQRESGGDEREAEEEREQEHPLGSVEVPLGAQHLLGLEVALGAAREHDREHAGDREAPAAEDGEQVDVLDMVGRDVECFGLGRLAAGRERLLDVEVGILAALRVSHEQRQRLALLEVLVRLVDRGRRENELTGRLEAVRGHGLLTRRALSCWHGSVDGR